MKVIERTNMRAESVLKNVSSGTIVKFRDKFHQSMSVHSPFMVVYTSDAYVPVEYIHQGKIPVVQMRTGRMSFVDCNRIVYKYHDAELHMEMI